MADWLCQKCRCSSAHLCVRQREGRHLCSHLNSVFLLLQAHLSLLLLLLQALNRQLPLHLQILLQYAITVSFPSSCDSAVKRKATCLFLLPHDLQFLGKLDLSLSLCLLSSPSQLLPVLLSQSVQCRPRVTYLRQFVLKTLIVHYQREKTTFSISRPYNSLWEVLGTIL